MFGYRPFVWTSLCFSVNSQNGTSLHLKVFHNGRLSFDKKSPGSVAEITLPETITIGDKVTGYHGTQVSLTGLLTDFYAWTRQLNDNEMIAFTSSISNNDKISASGGCLFQTSIVIINGDGYNHG